MGAALHILRWATLLASPLLYASGLLRNCDNQRCLQTFLNFPWGEKSSLLRITVLNQIVNCAHAQGGVGMITCSKHCFDINLCIYVYLCLYHSTHYSTRCSLAPAHYYLHICWLKQHLGFIVSSLSSGEIIALLHNPRYMCPAIYSKHMVILKVSILNFLAYIVYELILNINFKYLYQTVSLELPYSVFMQKKQQMIQIMSPKSYFVGINFHVHVLDDTGWYHLAGFVWTAQNSRPCCGLCLVMPHSKFLIAAIHLHECTVSLHKSLFPLLATYILIWLFLLKAKE